MARSRFTVGTRYESNKQVFIVRELLVDGKLSIENQSFGGVFHTTQDELSEAWACGEISFEVHGSNTRKPKDVPLITEFTVADFERLPAKWRSEAQRRLNIIRPLLKLPPEECTNAYIGKYVESLKEAQKKDQEQGQKASLPAQPDETGAPTGRKNGRKQDQRMGQALSRSSIRMWMNDFLSSGCDLRALVPGYHRYKGKGKSRLTDQDEKIIQAVLGEYKKKPAKRSADDVRSTIINRIVDEQGKRPQEELPSLSTMYRRIHKEGFNSILRRQRSHLEKHAEDQVFAGPKATRVNERIEIDDTQLDFIVVDLVDRLPIGRPTITKAIDAYSGMPYGFYIGFEPPSYFTIQSCLYHGIVPKPDCQKLYGTKHSWPVYGLPETLIVDNGRHYTGNNLNNACEQLGIILEFMPIKQPWWKARIESSFYSDSRGLIHTLQGTTFSNVLERGDYDSLRHACISLEGFMELWHVYLLDEYAIKWHDGVGKNGGVPMQLWEESVLSGYIPCLHHNISDLRYILYPGEWRTVQPSGIDFKTLRYQSTALAGLRSYLNSKEYRDKKKATEEQNDAQEEKVHVKYNPMDLSVLYIYDPRPDHEDWLSVPAIDQEYTKGLSIHKHNVIRSYILRQKKEVDIYELAEAKKHIQEIVEREYGLTRQVRGRKKAARYRGIASESSPNTASNATVPSRSQDKTVSEETEKEIKAEANAKNDTGTEKAVDPHTTDETQSTTTTKSSKRNKKSDNKSSASANTPPTQETEIESSDKVGWGGDYDLLL